MTKQLNGSGMEKGNYFSLIPNWSPNSTTLFISLPVAAVWLNIIRSIYPKMRPLHTSVCIIFMANASHNFSAGVIPRTAYRFLQSSLNVSGHPLTQTHLSQDTIPRLNALQNLEIVNSHLVLYNDIHGGNML